jgi:hypothetical protein
MLKHLTIACGAALLLGIFAGGGYLFANSNLNSSKSNIYKTASGKPVPFTYTFSITVDPATTLTVAERKSMLSQACTQAAQDIR